MTSPIQRIETNYSQYDKLRENVMIVGFALSLTLAASGLICIIFNLRASAMLLALLSLLVLVIIWMSFGLHLVADKFVYDVCFDMNTLISETNDTTIFKSGALINLWDCGNSSDFQQLKNLIDGAIDYSVNQTCASLRNLCYNPVQHTGDPDWHCSSSPPCGPDTIQIVTDSNHLQIVDGGQTYSVQECATNCTSAADRNASAGIVEYVHDYTAYVGVYNGTIEPLLNCELAANVLKGFQDPLCKTLLYVSKWLTI